MLLNLLNRVVLMPLAQSSSKLTKTNIVKQLTLTVHITNKYCSSVVRKMERKRVLITYPDIPKIAFDILGEECDLIICEGDPPTRAEILSKVGGVDAIFWSSKETLNKDMLNTAGPKLSVISTMSAGVDNVEVTEVKSRGIKIGNTPNVLNDAVADMAVLLTLAASRRMHEGYQQIVNGTWKFGVQWMLGPDIRGSTIGIVGLGNIGKEIVKRLQAFKVGKFIYTGRSEKPEAKQFGATFVNFETLLKESDVVIVACPLTPQTAGMFNDEAFNMMKETAIFVNIARGGIVDQDALVRALQSKTIFAAGLDVMTPEPLPTDHVLLSLPNCVLIPHLGSATVRTRNDMAELAARNILAGLNNKPMPSPL